jgi:hypothetical protein
MRIAITINLGTSLWSNGLNQNAIYLAMLFQRLGHNVDLIYDKSITGPAEQQAKLVYPNIVTLKESLKNNYDVLITLGFSVSASILDAYKKQNKKIKYVQYKCGNDFLVDMESLLFDAHDQRADQNSIESISNSAKPDQIWSIPQMENTNYNYYQFESGQDKVTVVPFVWDPIFIETEAKKLDFKEYTPRDIKNVAVMEPNINVFKNVIVPFMIASKYQNNGGRLESFHTFGTDKLKDKVVFKKLVYLSGFKGNVHITANGRFPVLNVLQKHADVALSWQWENPLNYLYLDVAWFGFPIIHNAHLCTDVGYYYPGFDVDKGADVLKNVIETHNQDLSYRERMVETIKKYTIQNKNMLECYALLLDNLMNDKFQRYSYNIVDNTIF